MEMICINCPLGCHLTINKQNDLIEVSGNTCPRGKEYAINELTNPTRTLTTTVRIKEAIYECLPVISSKPIPKDRIFDVLRVLKDVEVTSPVRINEVIVKNILDLDIDIIASRSM